MGSTILTSVMVISCFSGDQSGTKSGTKRGAISTPIRTAPADTVVRRPSTAPAKRFASECLPCSRNSE